MNGKTQGLKLSGPLTVQEWATGLTSTTSVTVVAVVVVINADDFVRFGFIVTASMTATDIANNKNKINTITSPDDTLADFLQNLYQRKIKSMKRKTVKVTAGPTMSPILFGPDIDARFLDAERPLFGIFIFKIFDQHQTSTGDSSSHFELVQSLKNVTDSD